MVINEYLPWPLNGCGVTSEFVELLNFGPGPINIGCYILTDGDYSITIPPNTILQPGQFYVISGQDVIIQPCDNVDSTITAHLNWNTCNCTSAPIPTTGDGFLTDGGSAAEQLVLLDPLLNVVDAVVRKLPAEPSSLITTSSVGGGCTPQTFDLDLMNIDYETIGESDGRGNSMARKTDGDCGWVKDSRQSGNATNNTAGEVSSLDASFYVTSGTACLPNLGSILIVINSGNMAEIFPLRYILAFDSNNDNVFDFNDTYTTGVDSTPNSLSISGLPMGRYRILIETAKGCGLTIFSFRILYCFPLLTPSFENAAVSPAANNNARISWEAAANEQVQQYVVQKSDDGLRFADAQVVNASSLSGTVFYSTTLTGREPAYRVKMKLHNGEILYSAILRLYGNNAPTLRLYSNPVSGNMLEMEINSDTQQQLQLLLFNSNGNRVAQMPLNCTKGAQTVKKDMGHLAPGVYFLKLNTASGAAFSPLLKLVKSSAPL